MNLTFSVSPEQKEVVLDHLFFDSELGILPDEKAWIVSQVQRRSPGARILKADLVVEEFNWSVTVEPKG